jgi:hypothetical protein
MLTLHETIFDLVISMSCQRPSGWIFRHTFVLIFSLEFSSLGLIVFQYGQIRVASTSFYSHGIVVCYRF